MSGLPAAERLLTGGSGLASGPGVDRARAGRLFVLGAGAVVMVGVGAAFGLAAGALSLVAVAVGLLVLERPALGGYLLVALVPVTSGLQRGLPLPGLRLSEVITVALAALIVASAGRRRAVRWRSFDWAALAYVVANAGLGAAALMGRGEPFTLDHIGALAGPLQYFLLYRGVVTSLAEESQRLRALRLVLLASAPVAILAILQQLPLPAIDQLVGTLTGFGDDPAGGSGRATGPFPHWQVLSGYLFVVVLVGVAMLIDEHRWASSRRALLVVLGLAAVALVQTLTAGPILGALVGVTLLALWTRRPSRLLVRLAVVVAVLAVAFAPQLGDRLAAQTSVVAGARGADRHPLVPQSVAYRYEVWKYQYLPALDGRWSSGYGPDLPPGIEWQYTESLYVTLVLRGGLPLLALYALMTLALLALAQARTQHAQPSRRIAARVLLVLLVLLILMHFFQPYFKNTGLPHVLWALAGILLAGDERGG